MTKRNIPNIISIGRILLVIPIVYFLYTKQLNIALVLFIIAGVSDGIDGYLAKHYDWTSELGAFLDPLADKLLLVSSYLVLGWVGLLPLWLVMAVIIRDLVIVSGSLGYFVLIGRVEMAPSIVSKINTAAQIGLVVVLLLASVINWFDSLVHPLIYVVFTTTVLSGLDYVWVWSKRAWQNRHSSEDEG